MLLISGCYLVPQLKGAGVTLRAITGSPYWVGVAVVAAIVALNVGLGGMRGVTYVQAFQYWVKVFAIAFPAILLLIYLGGLPGAAPRCSATSCPRTGPSGMIVELDEPKTLTFPDTGETQHRARRASCEYRRTPRSRSPRGSTPRPATSGRARSRSPAAARRC